MPHKLSPILSGFFYGLGYSKKMSLRLAPQNGQLLIGRRTSAVKPGLFWPAWLLLGMVRGME
jgi:hypothetical protein